MVDLRVKMKLFFMLELTNIILTLVIGLLAILIAYWQHRTGKDRLRLDLYEKRFSVYITFRNVVLEIQKEGAISSEGLAEFFAKIIESDFLFKKDIIEYKNEFRDKLIRLQASQNELESLLHTYQTKENKHLWKKPANEKKELFLWFSEQHEEIKNRFDKYLNFKRIISF